jgi:CheY-like chemotaxis protein
MTETVGNNLGRSVDGVASPEPPIVLVTDDHEDTRLLFRTILSTRGCRVIEAADGEQAVRLAESAAPDLILMDSILPRLSGLDATRRIRKLSNGRHTPIVFICGRAEPDYRAMALDAGCDEFLVKPLNFELFSTVLEKHLGKTPARSAA